MPETRELQQPCSRYANIQKTREILDMFGKNTKHHLGQNFLVNDQIIRKIIDLAQIGENDTVLEVGPGIGTLTCALLDRAKAVCSLEADRELEAVLAYTLADWHERFHLIMGDALKVTPDDVEIALGAGADLLVSNLPYQVAATIIGRTLEEFSSVRRLVVMVQAEVADRICAVPGNKNYGAFTAKLNLRSEVTGRFEVGPGNFMPAPHVNSAVIRIDRRTYVHPVTGEPLGAIAIEATCRVIDSAFSQRRKTLRNNLKSAGYSKETMDAAFEESGLDGSLRSEVLSADDFVRLAESLGAN